ncbi:MAG TPA: polysaccharide pyruvyl transferase family protein [Clostridia bacterium]|nr:polysaccharide pyruvyl transferase family protein [Clostridia bacterium]
MQKIIKETPVSDSECTGCGACFNICPTDAISMKQNDEGFWTPYIDMEKCILCYKCDKVCPVRTPKTNSNYENPECYAVAATDEIRLCCSSGGVFGLLAEDYLKNGGYVCGAKFDENFDLNTVIISDINNLTPLLRSKYVQSNTKKVFTEIKALLSEDKQVLYCGCPCQVAGLKQFLGKDYDNLLSIDFVCHGAPSSKALHKYLSDSFNVENIDRVDFRDKEVFGWSTDMNIFYKDGSAERIPFKNDSYYNAFLKQLMLIESCTKCKFATIPRQGDLTLGDFWGVAEFDRSLDDHKGTSILLINNQKGKSKISKYFNMFPINKKTPLDWATKLNKSLLHPYPVHFARKRFFDNLSKDNFTKNVQDCTNEHFDVGIVSIYTVENFGGALTYYGLYNAVKSLGYSVLMIERPANAPHRPASIEKAYIQNPYNDYECAKIYPTKTAMRTLNDRCSTFLVGSDQMFHKNLYHNFGEWCTLDWVNDSKSKIAYAASFGHDTFTGRERDRVEMSFFMKKFDKFSVRESSGVEIAKKYFGVQADWVLDPVFLCESQKYVELAEVSSKNKIADKYISSYILDPNKQKMDILTYSSNKLGLPVEMFSEMFRQSYETPNNVYYANGKNEDRLKSILESELVITDSFHGICFSIIFKKNFICIINNRRGVARMLSLLSLLGLENRAVNSFESFLSNKNIWEQIDFEKVNKKLSLEIERCTKWLADALNDKKVKSISDYDLMVEYTTKLETKINNLSKMYSNLYHAVLQSNLPLIEDIYKYVPELSDNRDKYVIIISAKDTIGHNLNDKIETMFLKLGVKTHLKDKHWRSYIAIFNKGKNVFEVLGDNEEPSFFSGDISRHKFDISSKVYRNGNLAEIKIDGKDYSVNNRGMNIVVYDTEKELVVDSVCFDTHVPNAFCTRKSVF